MSRWLKSVNNLLETLDGQAENAADGEALLGIDDTIGQLLENGRQAAAVVGLKVTKGAEEDNDYASSDGIDEYESYDEEELYSDDEEEEEVIMLAGSDEEEEEEVDDGGSSSEEGMVWTAGLGEALSKDGDEAHESVSIGIRRRRMSESDTVSDISFSEYTEEEVMDDDDGDGDKGNGPAQEEKEVVVVEERGTQEEDGIDAPPKTPTRYSSTPRTTEVQPIKVSIPEEGNLNGNTTLMMKGSSHSGAAMMLDSSHTGSAKVSPRPGSKKVSPKASPMIDQSPRPPRRSVDGMTSVIPAADAGFLDDDEVVKEDVGEAPASGPPEGSTDRVEPAPRTPGSDSAPPRLPTRQSSFPAQKKKLLKAIEAGATPKLKPPPGAQRSKAPEVPPPMIPPPPQQSNPEIKPPATSTTLVAAPQSKPSSVANPKDSKEYQKVMAKLQSLQAQLNKTTNELKTSQSEVKKFQKQVKTLDAQLETANAEITAQSEELRRAGERMEKDRLRAQEEREDLEDDHDDEIDQMKESHTTEMAELRNQYEKQVADLQERLGFEETRRRQEGGDWTKELEDAIERERDALKRLNEVEVEKSALQSNVSKLQAQQTVLQTKLESSLQSGKTAAEREREAEDKLDAALSLHARQMSQRQTREAELEKTIFDLGSALTVARQKQQTHTRVLTQNDNAGESFKEKYESVAEELETLKVQLNMETQRREALQQELNEISQERSEEASSAHARQRQHDRKVTELESSIARLQASLRELKQSGRSASKATPDGRASQLSEELDEAKSEIVKLSDQVVRHQGLVQTSKSEILALKGRLQAAISRADRAEQSLVVAQTSAPTSTGRVYEMEGGGVGLSSSTMRRRVKGGASRVRGSSSGVRSIRSALNIGPGRTSPAMEQVAITVDAIDSWMVETGAFMRHEPLARLGFLLYLMTLHLWSFALVIFHTTEEPHADFGSLDNNPRHWREHPGT